MNPYDDQESMLPKSPLKKDMEIHEEPDFSYDGYQVVRGEFFAHLFEPSITINHEKVSVNAACLRKLPDTEYVQFLVNPIEKKLAVKPCTEDMKDSFRWASGEGKKRKPRTITCKIFFAKIIDLMGWSADYRYKILGKLIRTSTDMLFVFDLTCAETYQHRKGGARPALYPEEWKEQFGVPVKDHEDTLQINIFDDYAVFRIDKEEEQRGLKEEEDRGESEQDHADTGYEETTDQDL